MKSSYPDLRALRFTAKIDFVTVHTPHRLVLPELDGKAKWPREHHNKRLTVHDVTASDLSRLAQDKFGPLRIAEIEVSIDVTCAPSVPESARDDMLKRVMVDVYAWGLDPKSHGLIGPLRGFYCPTLRKV